MVSLTNGTHTLYLVYKELTKTNPDETYPKVLAAVMTNEADAKKLFVLLNGYENELNGSTAQETSFVVADGVAYYFPSNIYQYKNGGDSLVRCKDHRAIPLEAITDAIDEALALFTDQIGREETVPYLSDVFIQQSKYNGTCYPVDGEVATTHINLGDELTAMATEFGLNSGLAV